ncbi:MAG: DHH family phosphoesterase [Candidatus Bathyarchaeota archaeon]|nr:DHH family phosphoesterase [Candidatus Bathyarchaeota archaeon]
MAFNKRTSDLMDRAKEAAERILEAANNGLGFLVISHRDADGISAAGIAGAFLSRLDAAFRIRIERWLDEKVLQQISLEKDSIIIMCDMGGGNLGLIKEKAEAKNIIIFDHHQPEDGRDDESILHINPTLCGIDGGKELSGAGTVYLASKAISENNVDLAHLAVIGALGDMQDKYEERRLGGVNEIIVEDAVKAGYLEEETDLLLFGRETRPIYKALALTTNPYIPGISGQEDRSIAFLTKLGIPLKRDEKWLALRDLSHEEKQRIFSGLCEYLLSKGYRSESATSLIGTAYVLKREEPWTPLRDAREYSMLLNAVGRTGRAGVGIAICLGDRNAALAEANVALEEYRQLISEHLKLLETNKERIEEMDSIYVIHGGQNINESLVSTISSILATNLPKSEKPLIAYSIVPEENIAKFSARTNEKMTEKGFNIGEIMRISAEKFSGIGGGHNIAAGAQVPIEHIKSFIAYVNDLVRASLMSLSESGSQN